MRVNHTQNFYSNKAALKIELSKNGIFFEVALATKEKKNNLPVFDWQNKSSVKFSISELCHLLEGLKAFRQSPENYISLAQKLTYSHKTGKSFNNFQFQHRTVKGDSRAGWSVFQNTISFIIEDGTSKSYLVQYIDIARIEMFLDFIIKMSFQYDSLEKAEKFLMNSNKKAV